MWELVTRCWARDPEEPWSFDDAVRYFDSTDDWWWPKTDRAAFQRYKAKVSGVARVNISGAPLVVKHEASSRRRSSQRLRAFCRLSQQLIQSWRA
jgi:hypothetical protein